MAQASTAFGTTTLRSNGLRLTIGIARIIEESERELSSLETLRGGKPIRESRDIDIPLAAAHFFYHAGRADKLELAFPGERRSWRSKTMRVR